MFQKPKISKIPIICGIFILSTISCMDKKEKDKSEQKQIASNAAKSNSPTCEYDNNIPQKFDELNWMAMLNYDLANDCTFQPIHVKIREGDNNSSEIIARFQSDEIDKDGKAGYNLNKIEFMYWEIASNPDTIVVVKPRVSDTIMNNTEVVKIEVELKKSPFLLNDNGERGIDCKWENGPHWIEKGAIIDVHIKNEDDIYEETNMTLITKGKQCTGKSK